MRKPTYLIAFVVAVMAVPIAVYASHQFDDVPPSHTFHSSITWMKDNGITIGCNPPANDLYCPDDPVTRSQMSAFLERIAEFQVVDAGALDGKSGEAYTNPVVNARANNVDFVVGNIVELAELTITAPAPGGLILDGSVGFEGSNGQSVIWIQVDNTTCDVSMQSLGQVMYGVIEQTAGAAATASLAGTAVVSAGPHTVTFCGGAGGTAATALAIGLVAEYATSVTKPGSLFAADGGSYLDLFDS